MRRRPLVTTAVAAGAGFGGAAGLPMPAVRAQGGAWPSRPIRMVVPYPPGGATDAMARLAAQRLGEALGVPVVVENRAGANGTIGTQAVLQAPADGYTLLGSDATHPMARLVMRNVPYDPMQDFVLLARTARAPVLFVINPRQPERTIAEVAAAARTAPERWSFAITSMGAAATLASIEFNRRHGTQIELVLYRGAAPAVTDVVAGNLPVLFAVIPSVLPLVRSGQLRPLAIAAAERTPLAPDLPSAAEAGLAGFEFHSWYGVWAPRGLPTEIGERINAALVGAMRTPEMARQLAGLGFEPVVQGVAEAQRFIAQELERNAELLRAARFEPQ